MHRDYELKTEEEFMEKLKRSIRYFKDLEFDLYDITQFKTDEAYLPGKRVTIKGKVFYNLTSWINFSFNSLEFRNCQFKEIEFNNPNFWGCEFIECEFIECRFTDASVHETNLIDCKIIKSKFQRSIFGDCVFSKNRFLDCFEIYDTYFGGCNYEENIFENCHVNFCRFESLIKGDEEKQITFLNSYLNGTTFNSFDLTKASFIDCIHARNIFANTIISRKTFLNNLSENSEFSSIDLHSLAKSDIIPIQILESIFGIKEHDIKNYSIGMTQDIQLQSVFISYSFSDKKFANMLNESLKRKGVFTFLWEKNAPGGKRLKEIMSENINSFDRILFIASQNSIKSEACQFELTQAREKQDKLWKTIFIPIHIDDYLFTLRKDDIRPKEKREEYWKNIQYLKEINSLDFKEFSSDKIFDESSFENAVHKLVSVLKHN